MMRKSALRIQGEYFGIGDQSMIRQTDSRFRFLLVVLSAYKQMHNQSVPVLSDVQEDNFDKAFRLFRPGMCGLSHNILGF